MQDGDGLLCGGCTFGRENWCKMSDRTRYSRSNFGISEKLYAINAYVRIYGRIINEVAYLNVGMEEKQDRLENR